MEIPVKALFLALLSLTLSTTSFAGTAYMCGTSDSTQKFMFKHANLNYVKAYTLSQCRANSQNPERCFEPFCQSFQTETPVRAPRVSRRAPARRPVARPAPRRRAQEDDCSAECWAVRAVESAKRQQREDEIDRVLRDYRDGKLHR